MSLNSEFFNKINQENQQRDNFVKSNLIREQIKFLFPNLTAVHSIVLPINF